jgi:hypothetical protein
MPPLIKIGSTKYAEPAELRETREALRTLGFPWMGFTHEPTVKGARFYITPGEPVTSGGAAYSALPLLVDFPVRFWFTVDLHFKTRVASLVLDQLGILVLGGTLAIDAREVFRAEWETEPSPHAQPHWHVYGSELAEAFKVGLDAPYAKMTLSRFHFAMSARWMDEADKDGTHHHIASTVDGVRRWIVATVTYSKQQLAHVGRHAAKGIVFPVAAI